MIADSDVNKNKTKKTRMNKNNNPLESKRLYKVFVSSTYLYNQERRRIVQDAIATAGMMWHGMEIYVASTRPIVDECLRYVQEADLFIGIIAWRYGWEPDGKKSITEMEYDAAYEAGIGRLMFQLDPDLLVKPDEDFDPMPDRWEKQEKLEAFKARFSKHQLQAYFNETNLGTKVLDALNKWRELREQREQREQKEQRDRRKQREQKPGSQAQSKKPSSSTRPEPDWDEEIRSYCKKAELMNEGLPVAGFATHINVPIDIEDIYVPLRFMIDLKGVEEVIYESSSYAEKCLRGCDTTFEIPLADAFNQAEKRKRKGLIILGGPGSGKTMYLKRILLYCLRNGPETIGLPAGMLPVFLPLRELGRLDQGLDAFIEAQPASPHMKIPRGFGAHLLRRGNLLFLLDGLDEVSDLSHREQVAHWIVEALKCHKTCRFVVTCRFAGYSPTVTLSERFLEMHIRPFSEEQAEHFIRNWYNIVERGAAKDPDQAEGIAAEKADELVNRLKELDFRAQRVFDLTRNPLLLANICLIHRHRGSLPNKRARLYEECIDVLLEHWREAKKLKAGVSAQDGRRALQPAALWLHSQEGRTMATASELAPYIEPVLKSISWKGGSAEDFLRTIRDESGLLTGWDQDNYGFMHRGFQEYLAAREIRAKAFKEGPAVLSELAAHFGESWWQEVGLLLLAMEDPSLFEPYMREVVKQPAFAKYPNLVKACLDDATEFSLQPFWELLETPAENNPELWDRQLLALKILEGIDRRELKRFLPWGSNHPSRAIRQWFLNYKSSINKPLLTEKDIALFTKYLEEDVIDPNSHIDIQENFSISFSEDRQIVFPIEDFYIPLKATLHDGIIKKADRGTKKREKTIKRILLKEAFFSYRKIVICGGPGSGKTTFLRFVAFVLAKYGLEKIDRGQELYIGIPSEAQGPVPIFIRLPALINVLTDISLDSNTQSSRQVLLQGMQKIFGREKTALLEDLLDSGHCALLLDGFDDRLDLNLRQKLFEVINDVLDIWGKNFIAISSRGLKDDNTSILNEMKSFNIDALGYEEITDFINKWVKTLDIDEDIRSHNTYLRNLKENITKVSFLKHIANNPMMLICLCGIYWNEKKIPEEKTDILSLILRSLLNAKEENRKVIGYDNKFVEKFLKRLSLSMTNNPNGKQIYGDMYLAIKQLEIQFNEQVGEHKEDFQPKIKGFLKVEMSDSNIIEHVGSGKFRFYQPSFQDYFAANALADLSDNEWWKIIEPHLFDFDWKDIIEHFAYFLKLTDRRSLNIFSEKILDKARAICQKNDNDSQSRANSLLEILAKCNPRWFAELQLKNARIIHAQLGDNLILRIQTGDIAFPNLVQTQSKDAFGWDIKLNSLEGDNVVSEEIKLLPKVQRVSIDILEFVADTKQFAWGTYQLTVHFMVKGSDEWQAGSKLISNVEPESPFIIGPPVKDPNRFFGHSKTIKEIIQKLDVYSIILLGPRRSGKTSLLYRLKDEYLKKEKYRVVFFDLHSYMEVSNDEIRLGLQYEIRQACGISQTSSESFALPEILKAELIRAGVDRVLILLDEMAVLSRYISFAFLLRAMSKWDKPEIRIVLVGTTRDFDSVTNACVESRTSWALNEFVNMELGYLSRQESKDLLEKPIIGYYSYEEEALMKLLKSGANRPFFLNILANLSLKELQDEGGRLIKMHHVNAALKRAPYEIARWFLEFLNELDIHTYNFLKDFMTNPETQIPNEHIKSLSSAGLTIKDGDKNFLDPIFIEYWKKGR
ncbi:MAG: NACHT domain-containing protein [bacterium]